MKIKTIHLITLGLLALAYPGHAQEESPKITPEEQKLLDSLHYQKGDIDIQNGLAKLSLTPDFVYLGPDDTETVLVKLWGNPPMETKPLGMILPAGKSPLENGTWAVEISYRDDGYVKDDDAGTIDYTAMLKQMKEGIQENNKTRSEQGYPPIELIGWATPPHYDAATHKLYWAKELKFGDQQFNTLNYDIRILGRHGVLVLSAIAGMDQLNEIEKDTPQILSMVNFNDGHRYTDFDPKVDKVATYGIGALVLGGIAAKMGLFKVILAALIAAKKFVIIGVVALVGAVKRLFGRKA